MFECWGKGFYINLKLISKNMRGGRVVLEVRMIGGWLLNLLRELTLKMVVRVGIVENVFFIL